MRPNLLAGLGFSLAAGILYWWLGFSPVMLLLWSAGLIVTGIWFWRQSLLIKWPLPKTELLVLGGLMLAMAPLYLAFIYSVPWQINTDEITIMIFQKKLATAGGTDPFGLISGYFYFPAGIFWVFGKIGSALGGVSLVHMRVVHAVSGLLIVATGYLLFRQLLNRWQAVAAAILLGTNHSLVMISRMAMRDNTGLLFELAALALLVRGFKYRDKFWTFAGGAMAGLSLYTYFPSRVTMVIWLLFLGLSPLVLSPKIRLKAVLRLASVALLGFALVAAPVVIATLKAPANSGNYQRQQWLFYPEGQALEQTWTGTTSAAAAIKANILNGLTTFNNGIHDQGYIYPNLGHGFVDPLTGGLVWIGLLAVAIKFVRKRRLDMGGLLAVVGFMTLWLSFAFLITKAPNYTRLLVLLPFAVYLAVEGIKTIVGLVNTASAKLGLKLRSTAAPLIGMAVVMIAAGWNLMIAGDFIKAGFTQGNDVGGTARYVEARRGIPEYVFYLAADQANPYYSWGEAGQWRSWLGFFAGADQQVTVVAPDDLNESLPDRGASILMNQLVWQRNRNNLTARYPNLEVHNITPDGRLVAVEVR